MKPIVAIRVDICTNATVQDVSLDSIENDFPVTWRHIAGINETTANTLTQIGWKRGRTFYPIHGAAPAALGRDVRIMSAATVPGNFKPTARFYGATAGDSLVLVAIGEVYQEPPLPAISEL